MKSEGAQILGKVGKNKKKRRIKKKKKHWGREERDELKECGG